MKASEKDIALFDRYFQGQLSISEQRHVDDRVKTDPEYAAAFNEYREFTQTMGLAGEIWLKNEFNKIESRLSPTDLEAYLPGNQGKDYAKKERRWNIMSLVMIIGSALLLVAFLIAIFNLPDLEEKFEQHKEKKTKVSEEKDTLIQDCTPILPLPFEALFAHFPELKGDINDDSDDLEVDSLGSSYEHSEAAAEIRPIMLCKREMAEGMTAYYVDERIKDSLILINFDCEDPELYLPNDTLDGIILRCKNELYRVFEDRFEPFLIEEEQASKIQDDNKPQDSIIHQEEINYGGNTENEESSTSMESEKIRPKVNKVDVQELKAEPSKQIHN